MNLSFLNIIPAKFRRRGAVVIFTIILRAVLNFVGLAMLLPVLMLILDADSVRANPYMERVFEMSGIKSTGWFIAAVCAAVVLVIAIKCLLNLWLYRTERNYIYALYRHMSRKMYIDYRNRGLQFIKNSNSSTLARNVNSVCLLFITGILRPAAVIVSESVLFLMIFTALAIYDLPAALLVVAIFLPSAWLYIRVVRGGLARYGEAENKAQRSKARNVIDTYRGYSDIEVNNAFPEMLARFEREMDSVVAMRSKSDTISLLPQIFTETGLAIGLSAMIVINLGVEGDRLRILFGVFAVTALRILPSIRNIMAAWSSIRYNRYTLPIIRDARIDGTGDDIEHSAQRMPFNSEISIENLSFTFDGSESRVLGSFSAVIRKGERVGIRGRSGSGKTTLLNLLLGFYEPSEGTIRIDGTPLTAANRRQWQNNIGYVSQHVFLADGTFADNIALGCPAEQTDPERIKRAIEMADLGEFVESLPDGINSRVGESGNRLSGGQRQRIGIARALYKQADILFFDEATSSLDSGTEENINSTIESLSDNNRELTIVIVAHRESSLERCDRIITID